MKPEPVGQWLAMLAVLTIVAVQLLFAVLLFGTALLDRPHQGPPAELRRRVR